MYLCTVSVPRWNASSSRAGTLFTAKPRHVEQHLVCGGSQQCVLSRGVLLGRLVWASFPFRTPLDSQILSVIARLLVEVEER